MIYMVNHQKQRFYWLSIQEDIFGQWCVVKVYGGLNNNHCREIWEPCESRTLASQRMFDIENVRRNRGYVYAGLKIKLQKISTGILRYWNFHF